MKKIRIVIILLCLCAIGVGCWNIFRIQSDYQAGVDSYEKLEQLVSQPSTSPNAPTSPTETEPTDGSEASPTETEPDSDGFPSVDFAALREISPNVVGWICFEGTGINYPVAQAWDNDFYLNRMLDGTPNSSGCIFLDYASAADFSDRNSVIYGHNMKNGTMFAELLNYKEPGYYEAHPSYFLLTPRQNYRVDIFAGVVLSGWGNAWKLGFADDDDFLDWARSLEERSCFYSGLLPEKNDRVVTLSTCTYEFDDARFVLLGILRMPIE